MALNYSIAMMGNPMNQEEAKKAYAKAQVSQELSLKALAKRVSSQTTASRADVTAVIIATVENMIDGLRAGEQVDFGDLGKFRLQITSRGGGNGGEIHGCQHYRSQYSVYPRRRSEKHLRRYGVLTGPYPCCHTRRAQSTEGRTDHCGYFQNAHTRRRRWRKHRWRWKFRRRRRYRG